jgi:tetratricopeptide (TPR) repeat protein
LASVLASGMGKREREAAIAEDRRAIRLAPDLALAHVRLAGDLLQTFNREGAVAEYRKVVRLDPDDVDAYHRLGSLLEITGDSNGAAEALKEATTRKPEDASLRIEFAYLLGSTGDLEGALVQAREAVRMAPTTAIVHHALARVMRTQGDEAGAAKEEQAAVAIQASNPPKRLRVGGQTMSAKLLYQPPPVYPTEAKLNHVEGLVRFATLIAADGAVESLKLISGPGVLAQTAADAVSRWRYQPTLLNGEMVEVETEIDVNFELAR